MATLIRRYLPPTLHLSTLHETHFPAPTPASPLSTEILRLSRALSHLLAEAQSPASELIREDNISAASEILYICLGDLTALLTTLSASLTTCNPALQHKCTLELAGCSWRFDLGMLGKLGRIKNGGQIREAYV